MDEGEFGAAAQQLQQGQGSGDSSDIEQFDLFRMPLAPAPDRGKAPAGAVASTSQSVSSGATRLSSSKPPTGAATRAHSAAPASNEAGSASLWHDEPLPAPLQPAPADRVAGVAPSPEKPKRRARDVLAATPSPDVFAVADALPPQVHLGTSSWSFPGWSGIVYGDDYSNSKLSRDGLSAYGAHPLLRTVSIDRSFYAPLTLADYLRYARQVPEHFRFIVKAPQLVTDATVRAERGEPVSLNPCFLNPQIAIDEFVRPCLDGLGAKVGALVFQFSPLPIEMLAEPAVFIDRLSAFLAALPPLPQMSDDSRSHEGGPCYAVEIRDACLLTPRFIRALRAVGVRYCVGIHARMPDPIRQAAALALLDGEPAGPLIVRWSLHGGFKYEQAKAKYDPFDRLVDEDPATRAALAELAARYAIAGQPVLIAVNNKAEGSAPLTCIKLGAAIAQACTQMRESSA